MPTGLSKSENLLILLKASEVSLPLLLMFHGTAANTGSLAGIFHFKLLAEKSGEKNLMHKQWNGFVVPYHLLQQSEQRNKISRRHL